MKPSCVWEAAFERAAVGKLGQNWHWHVENKDSEGSSGKGSTRRSGLAQTLRLMDGRRPLDARP